MRVIFGAVAALLAMGAATAQEAPLSTVWDGVYTDAQAEAGLAHYQSHCATCHAANMAGGQGGAPALTGFDFQFSWGEKTLADTFAFISTQMPPGEAGVLTDAQYAEVLAAILRANDFPAGEAELPADLAALCGILVTKEAPAADAALEARACPAG